MRTLVLLPFLLAIPVSSPLPTYGAERTWTIARDVYTTDAELVAVRGNLAYLRMDGKVEEIPIDRLSAIDQQYIASLSLAPILPGPAADGPVDNREIVQEEMPLPGEPDAPADGFQLNGPTVAPTYSGEPELISPGTYRVDQYGRVIPPQPGVAANYLAPVPDPRATNPNDRRYRRPPQQGPNNAAAKSQRDSDDNNAGILGFRERRLERQRAAARSR
jgi:hypothetical protein